MRYAIVCAFFLAFLPEAFGFSSGITYHGRILKPDNTPETDSNVQFQMQIRTPGSENCLMYEEVQTKNLSATSGVFAITLNDGTGSRIDTSGYGLDQIFGNRSTMTFTFGAGSCTIGTTYSPNVADTRSFVVQFKDSTMSSWEPLPPQGINFVPSAIEAYQVGGFPSASLLRVENGAGPQPVSSLTPAQAANLVTLSNGTSTQYVQSGTNGAPLPSFAVNPASPVAGDVWYDSVNKVVKYYDGTTIQTVGSGSVSGNSITSGTIGGSTSMNTTGTITAASISDTTDSTNNLKIYNAGNTHSVTVTVPAGLASDYPLQLPGAEPTVNGQVLSATMAGVMSWQSAFLQNGNSFGAPAVLGTTDNNSLSFETNSTTNMTITTAGNVGIGTTTPQGGNLLEVRGNIAAGYTDGSNQGNLYLYEGTHGTAGHNALIYADYNNLYLNNPDGPVYVTGAATQSTGFSLQESGGPFDTLRFWYDGTSGASTGGWVGNNAGGAAGSFSVQLGDAVGATAFNITDRTQAKKMSVLSSGNVGIGTTAPGTILDINGALSARGMAAPAVSPGGQGRIYYDSGSNQFMVSQNGGAYAPLGVGSAGLNTTGGTMTGELIGDTGSNAVPSFGFTGDTNTGFYDAGSHTIGVTNNGTESMVLSSTGVMGTGAMAVAAGGTNQNLTLSGSGTGAVILTPNVGIGTTNPAETLTVVAPTASSQTDIAHFSANVSTPWQAFVSLDNTNATNAGTAIFFDHAGVQFWSIGHDLNSVGVDDFFIEHNADAGAIGLYFDAHEHLGIGTTTPAGTLDVEGGTAAAGNGTNINLVAQGGQASGNTNGGGIILKGGPAHGTGAAGAVLVESSGSFGNLGILTSDFVAGSAGSALQIANGAATGNTNGTIQNTTAGATAVGNLALNPAGGNVGIGTTNPNWIFEVAQANGGTLNGAMALANTAATTTGTGSALLFVGAANVRESQVAGAWSDGTGTNGYLSFSTENSATMTEDMRITSNGNVGIGTTTPAGNLAIDNVGHNATLCLNGVCSTTLGSGSLGTAGGTMTGELIGDTGSNTTPSFGFTGDANTGFYDAGSHTIGVTNNGTESMVLSSTGVTGTGAMTIAAGGTNQNLALSSSGTGAVNVGTGNGTGLSVLDPGAASANYVTVKGAATGNAPIIGTAGTDPNINLALTPKGTGNVLVTSGNVGIGTTTPHYPLDINAPAGANFGTGINITNTGDNTQWAQMDFTETGGAADVYSIGVGNSASNTPGKFFIYDNNASSTRLVVDATGNVGIGTTAPAQALEIANSGHLRLSRGNTSQSVDLSNNGNDELYVNSSTISAYGTWVRSGGSAGNYGMDANTSSQVTQLYANGSVIETLTSSGNVGIGTTSPTSLMNIYGSGTTGGVSDMTVTSTYSSGNGHTGASIEFDPTADGTAHKYIVNATNSNSSMGAGNFGIFDATSIGYRLVINSSGNVGIGTVTPAGNLAIDNAGHNATLCLNGTCSSSLVAAGGGTMTGELIGDTGSNTTPSFGFTSDTNTGFYDAGSHTIGVTNNGTESMVLSSTGVTGTGAMTVAATGANNLTLSGGASGAVVLTPNVGIGTTGPTRALSINGTTNSYNSWNIGGTEEWVAGVEGGGNGDRFILYNTGAGYVMTATTAGNVGIGTTSPTAALDIHNSGDPLISLTSSNSTRTGLEFLNSDSNSDWLIGPAGSTGSGGPGSFGFRDQIAGSLRLMIDSSGNVGIGTTSPAGALDVETSSWGSIILGGNANSSVAIGTTTPVNGEGNQPSLYILGNGYGYDLTIDNSTSSGGTNPWTLMATGVDDNSGDKKFIISYNWNFSNQGYFAIDGTTGNIGIGPGNYNPKSSLDVSGNVAIGSYAGSTAAPSNGLIVSGNVGIGTTTPGASLDVNGGIRAGSETQVTACGASNEGTQRYNYTLHTMEFCNGSQWMQMIVAADGTSTNVTTSGPPVNAGIYSYTATLNYTPGFGSVTNINNGVWPANGTAVTGDWSCLELPPWVDYTATITIDLGTVQTIGNVYISGPDIDQSGWQFLASLSFSTDGTNYLSSASLPTPGNTWVEQYYKSSLAPNVNARYIRLTNGGYGNDGNNSNGYFSLCQFAVGP